MCWRPASDGLKGWEAMDKSNHDDLTRFRNAIAGMALTFRQETPEALFDGYWMGLSDLPIEAIERGVERAIRTCRFMPSVVELRELAGELSIAHRAPLAWAKAREAILHHGYTRSVNFDDPVINATIRAFGGWEAFEDLIYRTPESQCEGVLRKRFTDTYQALCARGITAADAAPLPGYHERGNLAAGYIDHIPDPVLVACDMPPHPEGIVPRLPEQQYQRLRENNLLKRIGTMPDDS